ncbi:MAG: FHA domain-containing protein [Kiritimatiellae bacterium]|nr:FHA domain-containing protein [Kiritimatiellia bacterium]
MANSHHLIVEEGNNKGLKIAIPPGGARLGRSSKNDVVLSDPSLSRHHCRLFFKTDDGLWITDLGSANETLVNNIAVQESRIRVDNLVVIGDTTLKVVNDGMTLPIAPVIDLGLSSDPNNPQGNKRLIGSKSLLMIGALVIGLAILAWAPGFLKKHTATKPPVKPPPTILDSELSLEIDYEKVQASVKNIFRYKLQIDSKRLLSIEIDDLENSRHVRREKPVDKERIQNLAKAIKDSAFFDLKDKYEGYHPGVCDIWTLSVTIDNDTYCSTVKNRMAPEVFKTIIEIIEEFGKSELGLWAIQFSAEKLKEMALATSLLGKKLYSEREVKYGNLFSSIKHFSEAEWYLETVEPKPDYYQEIVAGIAKSKQELQRKYDDINFGATRSYKGGEWEDAAEQLRVICLLIPDRADKRNKDARKRLILTEERIEAEGT